MTRGQSTAEDARNAMVAGLLASGISVNGLQPSHNPTVAAQMFTTATTLDPAMCDAWLARILTGDQSIEVLAGAWAAVRTFGWETRRLGVTDLQFRPEVSDGMFLRLAFATAIAAEPDPLRRLVLELLSHTGIRVGELCALQSDAVVQIGDGWWLRVPLGKLHKRPLRPAAPPTPPAARRLARQPR